jgi:Glycosyl hydrolase family 48
MAPLSRRGFVIGVGGVAAAAATGANAKMAFAAEAPALAADEYSQAFLDLYKKIKTGGYFSPQGVPYHAVETLMVEAPDHGHQTTSEAFSYWIWLEATYGRVTGDWAPFNAAWTATEKYIIPTTKDQPTNASYNPASPATYAAEHSTVDGYPSALDKNVSVGADPIANELKSAYGTSDMYAMHWLMDVDNVYGFGTTAGTGSENGPSASGPCYINTYQRGSQESVWETIPQPSTDMFKYGGKNGYLDLFTGDSSYSQQWKYTNAPDADARAVQAAYWAQRWATEQGKASAISASVAKAAKMGDFLRYALFDKYFKKVGNCTSPTSCAAGSGKNSAHYLLGWYFAWGGAMPGGGWAWRIADGAAHTGYQNPMAAWALSTQSALAPKGATAKTDWATSLTRQVEFLQWLQSAEGGIAGGATNSWDGAYAQPPAGTPTFYGMAYDWQPVYHDPPSNNWYGMQAWGMQRWAEYYYVSKDAKVKPILDKWVAWVSKEIEVDAATGDFAVPATLNWTGQPATWNASSPAANTNLHVTVVDKGQDVGTTAATIRTLLYYAKAASNTAAQTLAKNLLDALAKHPTDKGISVPETRKDYSRFNDPVYVPSGWTGKMPNGDVIDSKSTFLSIRSFYKKDPDFAKVQAYLDGGEAPTFTYHRFWAQADIAMAFATYSELFGTAA